MKVKSTFPLLNDHSAGMSRIVSAVLVVPGPSQIVYEAIAVPQKLFLSVFQVVNQSLVPLSAKLVNVIFRRARDISGNAELG